MQKKKEIHIPEKKIKEENTPITKNTEYLILMILMLRINFSSSTKINVQLLSIFGTKFHF